MKTDLTKHIESLLSIYSPTHIAGQKLNKQRQSRTVFECVAECGNISGGIIDCVRIDETLVNETRPRICHPGVHKSEEWYKNFVSPCGQKVEDLPELCDNTGCRCNSFKICCDNDVLITCFEIKISKADFHSKHGHNFVGNANFYVMPKELYLEVKDEIPDDIGVIAYVSTDKFDGLRCVKHSTYRRISDEDKMWITLSVLKKVEKNFQKKLQEEREYYLHEMKSTFY